jgi:hypothetical protein
MCMAGCVHVCNRLTFPIEWEGKIAINTIHSEDFTLDVSYFAGGTLC